MANKNADIRLLIGAEGGSSTGGALIRQELQSYFKDGLKIKVKLDDVDIGSIKARVAEQQKSVSNTKAELDINKQLEKSFERAAALRKKTDRTDELKQAAAINKYLEQEYQLKVKNEQAAKQASENSSKQYWDGRFKDSINDLTASNTVLKQMSQYYKELEKSSIQTDTLRAKVESLKASFGSFSGSLTSEATSKYGESIKSIQTNLNSLSTKTGSELKTSLQSVNNEIETLKAKLTQDLGKNAFTKTIEQTAQTAAKLQSQASSQLSSFKQYLTTLNAGILNQHRGEADEIINLWTKASKGSADDVKKFSDQASNAMKNFKASMKDLGAEGGNIFTYLEGKIKTFTVYLLSSAITMGFVKQVRNAISAVYDLDEALTNLRIVQSSTKESAQELLKTYNSMAQELGTTTTAVAESANEWLRQGYNTEDTNALIKNSMILSVVGMVDSAEAAQYLTSAMKGYNVAVSDSLGIVDKLTSVDLKAAMSAGGLAEAMSRTANSARLAGVDMNTLLGYIAAVGEVTQRDAATVGEAFKTIFARYADVKIGKLIDDDGESLSDFETVLSGIGVTLRDQVTGNFREFDDVMADVVEKYKDMDSRGIDVSGIAKALGGTRQRENVLTLLENYDKALEYAEAASDSAGTAMEKFGARQESLETKSNKLTAAFENMANSIIPSGLIGFFLDLGAGVANAASHLGGLPATIVTTTTAFVILSSALKTLKTSTIGISLITTFKDLLATIQLLPAALSAAASGSMTLSAALSAININPVVLGIAAAVTAFMAIKWVIDQVNVSLKEQQEIVSNLKSDISSLQSEYDQLNGKENRTADEERELAILKAQIEAKKEKLALEAREQEKKQFTDDTVMSDEMGQDVTIGGTRSQAYSDVDRYKSLQSALDSLDATQDDAAKKEKTLLEQRNEASQSILDNISALEDLKSIQGSLLPENEKLLQYLYDQAYALGLLTASTAEQYYAARIAAGDTASEISRSKTYLDLLHKETAATDELTNSAQSLHDVYTSVKDKADLAAKAQAEMSESGVVSVDTMFKLIDAGLLTENAFVKTANGYAISKSALDSLNGSVLQSYQLALNEAQSAAQEVVNSEAVKQSAYQGTTNTILGQLIAQRELLKSKYTDLGIGGSGLSQFKMTMDDGTVVSYSKTADAIQNILTAQQNLTKATQVYSAIQQEAKSKSSGSSVEEYVADIDALYEITKKLKDVQNEISTVEAKNDNLDNNDYEHRIENARKLLDLKQKENDILHQQTEMRRKVIQSNIGSLQQLGFAISYDPKSSDLLIKNMDHINELVGKDTEATNNLRKNTEELIKTTQELNDTNAESSITWFNNTQKAKEYKKQLMELRQEQADEWIDIREHENTIWDNLGGNESNIISNYEKMMDYVHSLANEYRKQGYSETSQEIRSLQEQWWDYYNKKHQLEADMVDEQKDNLSDIIDLTKELIKQEQNDLIDALEDEKDAYSDIIDLKKKSLELTKQESDYQDSVQTLNTDISKLQAQIDAVSLDNSRDAQAKKAELLDQLAEKQKDLADTQSEYSQDAQEDALDNELSAFEKSQDSKIQEIQDFLDDNEALTKAAMNRIDQQGDTLYDDLLRYALHYTDTAESELITMWDNAKKAAEEYGSVTQAMSTVSAQEDILSNGKNASATSIKAIVAVMKQNSSEWYSSSETERASLEKENKSLGAQIGATIDSDGVWWLNGEKLYEKYHSGTVSAGELPTPNQNELWALLEKGEAVLTKKQQNGLLGMIDGFASNLKFMTGLSGVSSAISALATASPTVVQVDASVQMNGAVSLSDEIMSVIKKYPQVVAEQVNRVLAKA